MIPNTHNKSQQIDLIYVFWFSLPLAISTVHCLVGDQTWLLHPSCIPVSPLHLALSGLLCLCWTGTEDYRLAALSHYLLLDGGWGCVTGTGSKADSGMELLGQTTTLGKLRYTGMRLTGIELAIWRVGKAQANYLQWCSLEVSMHIADN